MGSTSLGNYPQALEDFQECLALQLKHLPPHSRLLAESNYHVATALCYMDAYGQAIQHYNSSIKVIENRLGNCLVRVCINSAHQEEGLAVICVEAEQGQVRGCFVFILFVQLCWVPDVLQKVIDAAEGADGAAKEKTEQEELRQLLPEVQEKVADAMESQKAASLAIRQALVGRWPRAPLGVNNTDTDLYS